jgi:methylated-DNA-[protein]-cysteine S-methyltransferase
MDDTAGVYTMHSAFLDRYVQVGMAQNRILSVEFPRESEETGGHEILDRIERYLQGERDEFEDVEVAMTMPTAQREVLDAVQQVPYGENATVEQLEHMVPARHDEDDLQRTIRDALTANPAPIFIPTHRVRDGPGGMPAEVETRLRSLEGL